jgi:ABC-type multidrug transport system permease subunit
VPYIFVQTLVYGVIVYALIGLTWTPAKFFWYLFFMFFAFLYTSYYGMIMVGITPNATVASILSSALIAVWMVFSGFIIPRPVRITSPLAHHDS